jgi:cation transport ATPase
MADSIRNHFAASERIEHRRLRAELRRSRINLLIGVGFMIACLFVRELLMASETAVSRVLDEGLVIAGWVAMWGPIDVFLYGGWPIASKRRLLARLA